MISPVPPRLHTGVSSTATSPGLTAAVEKQFGFCKRGPSSAENLPPRDGTPRSTALYTPTSKRRSVDCRDWPAPSPATSQKDTGRVRSSQQMVDAFLNSRRRRLVESDESDVFL